MASNSIVVDWFELVTFYEGIEQPYPVYPFGKRVFMEQPLIPGATYPWAEDIPDDDNP